LRVEGGWRMKIEREGKRERQRKRERETGRQRERERKGGRERDRRKTWQPCLLHRSRLLTCLLRLLFEVKEVSAKNIAGNTALYLSSSNGRKELVKKLLHGGCEVNGYEFGFRG